MSITYHNALPLPSMLLEYRLESVLGAGAFGMTYLAWDTHLEKHVAIKEYLPTELAVRALDGSVVAISTEQRHDYEWGRERFILEARTLARFSHPNIVRVNRYFESNATGYMVMDYEQGASLSQLLKRSPRPSEAQLKALLLPLLDGLQAVHDAGFLHRDIKPSNVFMRENGVPVLLDFGAARQAIGGATKSLTAVLTPGYAPLEQYSGDGNQGPWSDIYALAGVLYRAVVDENPPDAVSRLRADTVPQKLAAARGKMSDAMLDAAAWALALDEHDRPRSIPEWRRALSGEARAPHPAQAAKLATTVRLDNPAPAKARPAAPASRPGRKETRASYGRWIGLALVLAAVVAGIAAFNKHKQRPDQTVAAPAPAAEKPFLPPGGEPKAAPAGGQAPQAWGAPERPPRERVDRDGGSSESSEQLRRQATQEFRGADSDGDGFLSRDEVRRYPYISREFQRVDSDGDGRISLQEFVRLRLWQAEQRLQK